MPLDVRSFVCSECGQIEDRDLNAARNILEEGTPPLVGSVSSLRPASNERTILTNRRQGVGIDTVDIKGGNPNDSR
jgi:transposase